MANYNGLLTDEISGLLNNYRNKSQMSMATAIRHLLLTHPELKITQSVTPESKPKPEPALKPGWQRSSAPQEMSTDEAHVRAVNIIRDLQAGRIGTPDAADALSRLEGISTVHKHVLSEFRHIVDNWEPEPSD